MSKPGKRTRRVLVVGVFTGLLIVMGLVAFWFDGRTTVCQASAADIVQLRKTYSSMNHSAHWLSYIGQTHDKIYLEHGTMVYATSLLSDKAKTTIYWAYKKDVSPEAMRFFQEMDKPPAAGTQAPVNPPKEKPPDPVGQ